LATPENYVAEGGYCACHYRHEAWPGWRDVSSGGDSICGEGAEQQRSRQPVSTNNPVADW